MLRRLSLARVAPLSAVVAVATACHTFGPLASPRDYLTTNKPPRVWVTEPDGSVAVFEGPKLVGDTLAGFVRGEYREVSLADVKSVSAKQSAPKRTRTVIIVSSVATIGFMLFVATGGLGVSSIPPDDEEPPN